jgi:hypothetical protein
MFPITATIAAAGLLGGLPATQQLDVLERDYKLEVRAAPQAAGAVAVSVRRTGRGEHALAIYSVPPGVTAEDVLALDPDAPAPPGFDVVAGTNVVPRRRAFRMTVVLQPGSYVLEDYGENGGKVNSRDRGMISDLQVPGAAPVDAALPPARATVRLRDLRIAMPARLPRRGPYGIVNEDSSMHQLTLVRLRRDATYRQAIRAFDGDTSTLPPGRMSELIGLLGARHEANVARRLQPGRYLGVCLMTNANGRLHAQLGMTARFRVR